MITQREFFNSMAEKWDTVCKHDANKIKYILNLLNIVNGTKTLDVGSGTGILIPYLTEKAGKDGTVIAVDVSEKMLEVAQQKYNFDNVRFVCVDVLEADLPKEFFDYVICYSVFPHFDNKEFAIKKISKYLKIGGKFMICHSQSRDAINNLHKNASEAVSEDDLPDISTIKTFFSLVGLNTIEEIDNSEMFVVVAKK